MFNELQALRKELEEKDENIEYLKNLNGTYRVTINELNYEISKLKECSNKLKEKSNRQEKVILNLMVKVNASNVKNVLLNRLLKKEVITSDQTE